MTTATTRIPIPESWYEGCPEITPAMRAEVKRMGEELEADQRAAHRRLVEQALKSNIPLARMYAQEELDLLNKLNHQP